MSFSRGNRNESDAFIDSYGRDATSNAWILTHQGAAFDVTGRLYDGHHRFRMVIKTGARIEIGLHFGLPVEAVDVTDRNKTRSVANALEIKYRMPDAKRIVSWLAVAMKLERGMVGRHVKFSVRETEAGMDRYGAALRDLGSIPCKRWPSGFWGVPLYAHGIDAGEVVRFASGVVSGASLAQSDPSFRLREYMLSMRDKKMTAGEGHAEAVTIHTLYALRAHLEGRELGKLSIKRDPKAVVEWFRVRVTAR